MRSIFWEMCLPSQLKGNCVDTSMLIYTVCSESNPFVDDRLAPTVNKKNMYIKRCFNKPECACLSCLPLSLGSKCDWFRQAAEFQPFTCYITCSSKFVVIFRRPLLRANHDLFITSGPVATYFMTNITDILSFAVRKRHATFDLKMSAVYFPRQFLNHDHVHVPVGSSFLWLASYDSPTHIWQLLRLTPFSIDAFVLSTYKPIPDMLQL